MPWCKKIIPQAGSLFRCREEGQGVTKIVRVRGTQRSPANVFAVVIDPVIIEAPVQWRLYTCCEVWRPMPGKERP